MKTTILLRQIGQFFFVLLVLALVSSCAPRITLLVSPEAHEVGQLIAKQALGKAGLSGLVVAPDSSWPKDGIVVRLTSTPAWNLPVGAPSPRLWQPSEVPQGFSPLNPLAEVARHGKLGWRFIPLFCDPVGVSRAFQNGRSPQLPTWGKLNQKIWKDKIAIAGAEPLFRQAMFFLENPDLEVSNTNWFVQDGKSWKSRLAQVSTWIQAPFWTASTWQFTQADLVPWLKPNSPLAFVTTYRHFSNQRSAYPQAFSTWIAGSKNQVLTGEVLGLEVFGPTSNQADLAAVVKLVTNPSFENTVGVLTHWIPVDMRSAEIDDVSAHFRHLASQTPKWFAVSNRLPKVLLDNNGFSALEVAFNFAKKR